VVGTLGGMLGAAGVNIARMQVARSGPGEDTLMVLAVDSAPPPSLLTAAKAAVGASVAASVDLTAAPSPASEPTTSPVPAPRPASPNSLPAAG